METLDTLSDIRKLRFGCWMYSADPPCRHNIKVVRGGTCVLILESGSVKLPDYEHEQNYSIVVDDSGTIGAVINFMLYS